MEETERNIGDSSESSEKRKNINEQNQIAPNVEAGVKPEQKEKESDKKAVLKQLNREIDVIEQKDPGLKAEALKKAKKIEFLGEKEKLEHLLQIARDKGVIYAIQVARKTNEPYIIDLFHDILAQEGRYKDYKK